MTRRPGRQPSAFGVLRHLWASDVHRVSVGLLAPVPGEHVLDVGAGLGPVSVLAARLVRPGGRVTALDPSRLMRLVIGARRLAVRAPRTIRTVAGVAEAVPVPAGAVDAAVGLNVVHLLSDVDAVAAELTRVLRPGGRVLFVEEDLDDPGHTFHGSTPHGPDGPTLDDLADALERGGLMLGARGERARVGSQPARTLQATSGHRGGEG